MICVFWSGVLCVVIMSLTSILFEMIYLVWKHVWSKFGRNWLILRLVLDVLNVGLKCEMYEKLSSTLLYQSVCKYR